LVARPRFQQQQQKLQRRQRLQRGGQRRGWRSRLACAATAGPSRLPAQRQPQHCSSAPAHRKLASTHAPRNRSSRGSEFGGGGGGRLGGIPWAGAGAGRRVLRAVERPRAYAAAAPVGRAPPLRSGASDGDFAAASRRGPEGGAGPGSGGGGGGRRRRRAVGRVAGAADARAGHGGGRGGSRARRLSGTRPQP
jgi:hypothetical protein